jgi:hypothetical protein
MTETATATVDTARAEAFGERMVGAIPIGPTLYMFSTMHCMTVSLAEDGAGLGTVWGEQKVLEMLVDAGFRHVDVKQVEGDFLNNCYIARAG